MDTGDLLGKPNKNCRGVTCDGLAFRRGEVEILLAASKPGQVPAAISQSWLQGFNFFFLLFLCLYSAICKRVVYL